MTTATSPSIVCPAWCQEHWACDEHLRNPEHLHQHATTTRAFGTDGTEGGVEVDLNVILHTNGDRLDEAGRWPSVYVAETPMTPAAARELGWYLIELADRADEPISDANAEQAQAIEKATQALGELLYRLDRLRDLGVDEAQIAAITSAVPR
jgi:hypothetical protein